MLDLLYSILKQITLLAILGTSVYAFYVREYINAFYFALMYICLIMNYKQLEE